MCFFTKAHLCPIVVHDLSESSQIILYMVLKNSNNLAKYIIMLYRLNLYMLLEI